MTNLSQFILLSLAAARSFKDQIWNLWMAWTALAHTEPKDFFSNCPQGFYFYFLLPSENLCRSSQLPVIQANLLITPVSLCYLLFPSPPFPARPHVLSLAHLLHYQSLGLVWGSQKDCRIERNISETKIFLEIHLQYTWKTILHRSFSFRQCSW